MNLTEKNTLFTPFKVSIKDIELPDRFTFPFYYEPHPLSILAAEQIQDYIQTEMVHQHNFGLNGNKEGAIGKMMGVLVVQNQAGEVGFLAAFSGKLGDSNHHDGFVPPVFDMLTDGSFFLEGSKELNAMNAKIKILEVDPDLLEAEEILAKTKEEALVRIAEKKAAIKAAKKHRDFLRKEKKEILDHNDYENLLQVLRNESSRHHFQLKDLKIFWANKVAEKQELYNQAVLELNSLKEKRKKQSHALQQRLFDNYSFLNKEGKKKNLKEIFEHTSLVTPPAGAGECSAPKLLQYAFSHQLKPLALGEFWWGISPDSEIRKHKQFYPSCRGKCEPILNHMLEGMELETNPIHIYTRGKNPITTVYEDDHLLVINKPPELLSTPGKVVRDSVWTRMKHQLPSATGPLVVHRLDMSTSGLLIITKTKEIHKAIQFQFAKRTIKKRYIALLEGTLEGDEGNINLPLRVDLDDRPRQLVCYDHGKSARTNWKVIERKENKTRIHFFPITGRTHQLRVHSAHPKGLNIPIIGDDLYGNKSDRLYLHAEQIEFIHPVSKEKMVVQVDPDF